MTCHLVFDVGGTTLRAGLYDPETRTLTRVTRGPAPGSRPHLCAELVRLASELCAGRAPASIVVAFAGPVDPSGAVLAAPTLWGAHEGFSLQDDLRNIWPAVPVRVVNDMTAAGYRYMSDPHDTLCVITVSSGIGHKVFIDGKPAVGPHGRGGEIGHLRVDFSPDAPECDCGGRGHLGAVASGRGALRFVQRSARENPEAFCASMLGRRAGSSESIDNPLIAECYRAGDRWTCRLVEQIAQPLARAIAGIHLAVGVERFVVIGGFATALGPDFRTALCRFAAESTWNVGQDWSSMIELGEPDDDPGLLGAGRFAESMRCAMR